MTEIEILRLAESIGIPFYIEETEQTNGYSIDGKLVQFARAIETDIQRKLTACCIGKVVK